MVIAQIKEIGLNNQQKDTINDQTLRATNNYTQSETRNKKYLKYQKQSAFQKIHGFKTKG